MALPATNITISAANLELGNSSSTTISVGSGSIRSLGGDSGSGTSFGMGSLNGQSGVWIIVFGSTSSFTATFFSYFLRNYLNTISLFAPTYIAGSAYYIAARVDYYKNGLKKVQYAYQNPTSTAVNYPTYIDGVVANASQTTLYSGISGGTPTSNYAGFSKTSMADGSILAFKTFATYGVTNGGMRLDSSENLYYQLVVPQATGGSWYGVGSVDSSLNWRWGRLFQAVNNGPYPHILDVDNSGYLRMSTTEATSESQSEIKYFQLNTSNGDIVASSSPYYSTNHIAQMGISRANLAGQMISLASARTSSHPPGIFMFPANLTAPTLRTVTFNGTNSVAIGAYAIATDGTTYICGSYNSNSFAFIIKMTFSGTILWVRKIQFAYNGTTQAMAVGTEAFLGGTNDGILNVVFLAGPLDEYGEIQGVQTLFSLKTDGSGTGTYSSNGYSYTYSVETGIAMGTAGVTAAGTTRTYTYASQQNPQTATLNAGTVPNVTNVRMLIS
jgi:hypothetical protein